MCTMYNDHSVTAIRLGKARYFLCLDWEEEHGLQDTDGLEVHAKYNIH
jgi:hypothetical protein